MYLFREYMKNNLFSHNIFKKCDKITGVPLKIRNFDMCVVCEASCITEPNF